MDGKLWAGRFAKQADSRVNDFNSSIRFDSRMFAEDIAGSAAHAEMLAACGIISEEDGARLVSGLERLKSDIESGAVTIPSDAEDIHTFVEAELTARLGDAAKRLHTARSRNDQVALDLRLYLRNAGETLRAELKRLCKALCAKAAEHTRTLMPGYTHLQRAQPVTLAHHLMAYVQMLLRDISRLDDWKKRMNECPLGAGALAATTYPIDRFMTARALGFDGPCENSLDAVSDRDFCMELLACLSVLMVHLSRFSEEIILWCSWEFKFIELDDAFATGSSIMPQKKNPDVAELVRGKSGRVFGGMAALLAAMKGLPLAYNKDMQEDKEAVFDGVDTVLLCLSAFTPMIETMSVNAERMKEACARGFLNATDCADYLVGKGLPFRDAYKITGALVSCCIEAGETLESLPLEEYRAASPLFGEDVYEAIAMEKCLEGRSVYGGPAPAQVEKQIENAEKKLNTL